MLEVWHNPKQGILRKSITLLLCLSVLFPCLTWAFEPANFAPAAANALLWQGRAIAIPETLAQTCAKFQGQDQLIIHIQDLHCNYEVQKNIAQLLAWLAKYQDLKLVCIEGASQPVNTTKLSSFPIPAVREEVADYFMRQGRLSGAEFYAATGAPAVSLQGIETAGHYAQARADVKKFVNMESLGMILDMREALGEIKPKVAVSVMAEWHQVQTSLDLMEKALNISATPQEWAEFQNNPYAGQPRKIMEFLGRYQSKPIQASEADLEQWQAYLEQAKAFYGNAEQRSQDFADNVLAAMRNRHVRLAVLITGGYHTEKVLARLKQHGCSYLSLKPRLTQQNAVNPYFSLLGGQKSGLEKLLAQQRPIHTGFSPFPKNINKVAGTIHESPKSGLALEPYLAQWLSESVVLDESSLPADIQAGYRVLEIILKLDLIDYFIRQGCSSLGQLKAECEAALQQYAANTPELLPDMNSGLLFGKTAMVRFQDFFAVVGEPAPRVKGVEPEGTLGFANRQIAFYRYGENNSTWEQLSAAVQGKPGPTTFSVWTRLIPLLTSMVWLLGISGAMFWLGLSVPAGLLIGALGLLLIYHQPVLDWLSRIRVRWPLLVQAGQFDQGMPSQGGNLIWQNPFYMAAAEQAEKNNGSSSSAASIQVNAGSAAVQTGGPQAPSLPYQGSTRKVMLFQWLNRVGTLLILPVFLAAGIYFVFIGHPQLIRPYVQVAAIGYILSAAILLGNLIFGWTGAMVTSTICMAVIHWKFYAAKFSFRDQTAQLAANILSTGLIAWLDRAFKETDATLRQKMSAALQTADARAHLGRWIMTSPIKTYYFSMVMYACFLDPLSALSNGMFSSAFWKVAIDYGLITVTATLPFSFVMSSILGNRISTRDLFSGKEKSLHSKMRDFIGLNTLYGITNILGWLLNELVHSENARVFSVFKAVTSFFFGWFRYRFLDKRDLPQEQARPLASLASQTHWPTVAETTRPQRLAYFLDTEAKAQWGKTSWAYRLYIALVSPLWQKIWQLPFLNSLLYLGLKRHALADPVRWGQPISMASSLTIVTTLILFALGLLGSHGIGLAVALLLLGAIGQGYVFGFSHRYKTFGERLWLSLVGSLLAAAMIAPTIVFISHNPLPLLGMIGNWAHAISYGFASAYFLHILHNILAQIFNFTPAAFETDGSESEAEAEAEEKALQKAAWSAEFEIARTRKLERTLQPNEDALTVLLEIIEAAQAQHSLLRLTLRTSTLEQCEELEQLGFSHDDTAFQAQLQAVQTAARALNPKLAQSLPLVESWAGLEVGAKLLVKLANSVTLAGETYDQLILQIKSKALLKRHRVGQTFEPRAIMSAFKAGELGVASEMIPVTFIVYYLEAPSNDASLQVLVSNQEWEAWQESIRKNETAQRLKQARLEAASQNEEFQARKKQQAEQKQREKTEQQKSMETLCQALQGILETLLSDPLSQRLQNAAELNELAGIVETGPLLAWFKSSKTPVNYSSVFVELNEMLDVLRSSGRKLSPKQLKSLMQQFDELLQKVRRYTDQWGRYAVSDELEDMFAALNIKVPDQETFAIINPINLHLARMTHAFKHWNLLVFLSEPGGFLDFVVDAHAHPEALQMTEMVSPQSNEIGPAWNELSRTLGAMRAYYTAGHAAALAPTLGQEYISLADELARLRAAGDPQQFTFEVADFFNRLSSLVTCDENLYWLGKETRELQIYDQLLVHLVLDSGKVYIALGKPKTDMVKYFDVPHLFARVQRGYAPVPHQERSFQDINLRTELLDALQILEMDTVTRKLRATTDPHCLTALTSLLSRSTEVSWDLKKIAGTDKYAELLDALTALQEKAKATHPMTLAAFDRLTDELEDLRLRAWYFSLLLGNMVLGSENPAISVLNHPNLLLMQNYYTTINEMIMHQIRIRQALRYLVSIYNIVPRNGSAQAELTRRYFFFHVQPRQVPLVRKQLLSLEAAWLRLNAFYEAHSKTQPSLNATLGQGYRELGEQITEVLSHCGQADFTQKWNVFVGDFIGLAYYDIHMVWAQGINRTDTDYYLLRQAVIAAVDKVCVSFGVVGVDIYKELKIPVETGSRVLRDTEDHIRHSHLIYKSAIVAATAVLLAILAWFNPNLALNLRLGLGVIGFFGLNIINLILQNQALVAAGKDRITRREELASNNPAAWAHGWLHAQLGQYLPWLNQEAVVHALDVFAMPIVAVMIFVKSALTRFFPAPNARREQQRLRLRRLSPGQAA